LTLTIASPCVSSPSDGHHKGVTICCTDQADVDWVSDLMEKFFSFFLIKLRKAFMVINNRFIMMFVVLKKK
jgi:hypothetical protein